MAWRDCGGDGREVGPRAPSTCTLIYRAVSSQTLAYCTRTLHIGCYDIMVLVGTAK